MCQLCSSCGEELPQGSLMSQCRECYDELTAGIISHEPAKMHFGGRVSDVEKRIEVYDGKWAEL